MTALPEHSAKSLRGIDLVPNEIVYLNGDHEVWGHIPEGVRIEITDGNLTFSPTSSMGKDCKILNETGNIDFTSSGRHCDISAPNGHIEFIRAGAGSHLTAHSIDGVHAEEEVSLQSTQGSIAFKRGGHSIILNSAKNITFDTLSHASTITAPNGILTYTSMDPPLKDPVASQIHGPIPSVKVSYATHEGKLELCRGVMYDPIFSCYVVEMPRTGPQKLHAAYSNLFNTLGDKGVSRQEMNEKKTYFFVVHVPKDDSPTADIIETHMSEYIATVKSLETGKLL